MNQRMTLENLQRYHALVETGTSLDKLTVLSIIECAGQLAGQEQRVRALCVDGDGNDLYPDFAGNTVGDIRAALDGKRNLEGAKHTSHEYTPSRNDVREVWGGFSEFGGLVIRPSGISSFLDDRYAEFDRWLQQERGKAKQEALREAADEINQIDPSWNSALWIEPSGHYVPMPEWLRDRANQYKEGEQ